MDDQNRHTFTYDSVLERNMSHHLSTAQRPRGGGWHVALHCANDSPDCPGAASWQRKSVLHTYRRAEGHSAAEAFGKGTSSYSTVAVAASYITPGNPPSAYSVA